MARSSRRRRDARAKAKPSVKDQSSLHMLKGNGDSGISSLPEDILVNILERLNVRDVSRTSVVSRSWSRLPAKLSRFTISAHDLLSSQTSRSDDELVRVNAAVAKAAKSMLVHRDPAGYTIRFLSTMFYFRDDAPICVGHAVGNAMATNKVDKAEFIVLTEKEHHECTVDDMLNYGARFVSFFNECLNAFAGLTRLYLANLIFAESDFVSNILVTCKQLNYLGFLNCNTKDWITLQVEHAQLSELNIVSCRFGMVMLTWLPKLTYLAFEYWMPFEELPLSLGYVPLLEVLRLSNIARSLDKTVKLSTFLHETSVQDLMLGFKCEEIWIRPECLTREQAYVFHQLRILNLVKIPEGYDLTWTMFFLEAAPSLEELYMMVMDHHCEMQMNQDIRTELLYSENKGVDVEWVSPTSNFKHRRLAKFVLFGFQVKDHMVNHVRRVLKAAVNLQDVYLYDRLTCDKCSKKVRDADIYRMLVLHYYPGTRLPIKFPYTNEECRSVKKRMPRGIGSLAKIHFLRTIRAEHLPRIAGDSLRALEGSWRQFT